jgi:hypothetical protein
MNVVSLALAVVAVAAAVVFPSQTGSPDDAGVRAAVELYFRGVAMNSADDLNRCFDPNAHLKLVRRNDAGTEQVVAVPIDRAIASWTSRPHAKSWGRIVSVEQIDGRIAVVKAEVLWQGHLYLDVLTLYRVNSEWHIVDKIFVDEGEAK